MESQENQNNDVFVVNGIANYSFVKESVSTVSSLSSLFGLFYKMGWYYKQWAEIKKCNESYKDISPFWRGVFYIGYASQFKKIVVSMFEVKKNMILQNEAVPQEEKVAWQKEYDKLNSIFAKFSLQQKAINKIVPLGHPEGSSLKFAGLLGLPFFILLVLLILGINILPTLFGSCFKAEGNVFKNTCYDYSFTFPFNGTIGYARNDGFDTYCQGNEKNHVCITTLGLEDPSDFNLETLASWESNKILNKSTTKYAGNTTHCFKEESKDKQIYNICYMQVKKDEPLYFGFFSYNETGTIDDLEKLMNSYKDLK